MKGSVFVVAIFFSSMLFAQEKMDSVLSDSLDYETFEMKEGDTTYVMKKYFLLTYLKGSNRDQTEEETNKIQAEHMAHMDRLAAEKKICIAGPFGEDGEERGIIIFSTYTKEEAQKLAAADPAVIAGRLNYTLKSIWLAKGSSLF